MKLVITSQVADVSKKSSGLQLSIVSKQAGL